MTDKIEISSQHSELGPSASERWLECPGSVLLSRDVISPDTVFAAEGNAAHELSEWARVQQKPAEHWRGTIIKVGEFEFEVDQEMIDSVDEFVEYVEQWPGRPMYEERVYYEHWVPNGFGTLDDGRLEDGVCRITDFKHGKGVQVFADDNSQLKLYGVGTREAYKHLYEFDRFILTIVQPRLNHVDQFEIGWKELEEWMNDVVKPTAARALEPGAPLKAGDHCRFCPVRRVCRVRAQYVNDVVYGGDFENLDAPRELMSNDEIALALPALSNIKSWCNDLEAHAIERIQQGETFVHPELGTYKLVEGRSNRTWRHGEKETAERLALELDDPDEIWNRNLLSPAQAERKLGKKVDISDLIVKPPGRYKLAPGTDKREDIKPSAENEFRSLDE